MDSINFKYTGQPITCYLCNSTEHVIRNCDKQRRVRPSVNQRLAASGGDAIPGPPIPQTDTAEKTKDDMDQDTEEPTTESSQSQPPSYAQISDPNKDLSPSAASRDLFETASQTRKRPPLSPGKSDNPEPKQQQSITATARRDPAFKFLYAAVKQSGNERKKLMTTIPGPQYYRCQALYLQHCFGNRAELDLQSPARHSLNDRELKAWVDLHRMITQDALAELIKISQALSRDYPGLFNP